jgi:hypothetical protein
VKHGTVPVQFLSPYSVAYTSREILPLEHSDLSLELEILELVPLAYHRQHWGRFL